MDELKTSKNKTIVTSETRVENYLDVASFISSAVPWIGGPVSNILSGVSFGRKLTRVKEVLKGLARDLSDFRSEASESYVKTEEFEDLLERTLRQAADEQNEEKRHLYKAFLTDAIKSPGEPYDDQHRFLHVLEELQMDHMKLLRAFVMNSQHSPTGESGLQFPSLKAQLPEMAEDRVLDLLLHLNNLGITYTLAKGNMSSLTPFGRRFVRFIADEGGTPSS